MSYIKKLTMHGFKSFVKKTELPFTPGINVILGPNGSGKSNISDALCFVLGRLSVKSMRASKAKNLIFMGTKVIAPAKEAMVEIVFDNSDKTFSIDKDEIAIKRIVRKNKQSVYKINNETTTRQSVLTLLAQAGIDPYGFNIILQGEIQSLVSMHTDERRKIIEEVSGISVYELGKEKSLKEL
ncbi:AAA family ATPase, partial [Candidatus Pacearchaeota archaeon]|nr:AAA family ATPase [Candidatus Pacearchaeota archaeon]